MLLFIDDVQKGFRMTALMIFCGAATGIIQFYILKNIVERILISNKSPMIPIMLKVVVYAAAAILLLTILRNQIFYFGIGFGGGITVTPLIYFFIIRYNDKNSFGKGEK